MANVKRKLATLDAETDPFRFGRKPIPFCWGLYTGDQYYETWGEDCTDQLIALLESITEPLLMYAHNGGKFDFYYLVEKHVITDPKIINGRIVSAKIGIHEIRDSYAIIPVPLAAYQKQEIDYNLFEKETREANKNDILYYLASDCENLFELVSAFVERFGTKLTIGSTAIQQVKEFHPFERQDERHDERFRKFYFGGRVECFEKGIIKDDLKYFDVNSMYPEVMANCKHPTGRHYINTDRIDDEFIRTGKLDSDMPYFIEFVGNAKGALPVRTKQGLDFNAEAGLYYATSHEFQVGLKYNLIDIYQINEILIPEEYIEFGRFIKHFQREKIEAKKTGDKTAELFSKLLQNSSYGKFAQSPDNFKEWYFRYPGEGLPNDELDWEPYLITPDFEIWSAPSPKPVYFDVATAASITGAARAKLLDAICKADRPIYCDTDSIICRDLPNVKLDKYKLGCWDCEATGDEALIAGKKMYALLNNGDPVKIASKGVRLDHHQIRDLCKGETVEWSNDAPTFKLANLNTDKVEFIHRKIKMR